MCQTPFLLLADIGCKGGRKEVEILKNTWELNLRSCSIFIDCFDKSIRNVVAFP